MTKLFTKFALAAGALVALPGMAQAGTSTASGAASMTVVSQCRVTGATVNLGTYTTNQTWGDVAAVLGNYVNYNFVPGSLGTEYLNYGSVTCDAGIPYSLSIAGTGGSNGGGEIILPHNGKNARLMIALKKIGNTTLPDDVAPGVGYVFANDFVGGVGTGTAQPLLGSVIMYNLFNAVSNSASDSDALAVAGVSTDTLSYTLNF